MINFNMLIKFNIKNANIVLIIFLELKFNNINNCVINNYNNLKYNQNNNSHKFNYNKKNNNYQNYNNKKNCNKIKISIKT